MIKLFKNTIVFLLLFVPITVVAQEIKWSELNTSSNNYLPYILHEDKESFYLYSIKNEALLLERYDNQTLKPIYSREIANHIKDLFGGGLLPTSSCILWITSKVYFMDNQVIVFFNDYDNTTNEYVFSGSIYDAKTGEKKKEKVEICRTKQQDIIDVETINYTLSNSKNFMVLTYIVSRKSIKSNIKHNIIINSKLKTLIDVEEIAEFDSKFKTFNHIVDNDGSMYYFKKDNESKNYIVSCDVNKDYEVWEEEIDLEGLKMNEELTNITISINSKNELNICGFRTQKGNTKTSLNGWFYMKINGFSKEIVVNKIEGFSKILLNTYERSKKSKKKEEVFIPQTFDRTKILNKDNGGIVFIAENFFKKDYKKYYKDFIILNISEKGQLLWDRRVKKSQFYNQNPLTRMENQLGDEKYYSYLSCLGRNQLILFYNCNPKNLNKGFSDSYNDMRIVRNSELQKLTFNLNDGEIKSTIIEDLKSSDMYLKPLEAIQIKQGGDVILFAQYKEKYKFGILRFNE